MVDKNTATARARAYIATLKPSGETELVLQDNLTIEKPFGWVFFYNSKKFVETGDYRYALLGNAPLIVDRRDGSLHETGTAQPLKFFIEKYERQRADGKGRK